MKSVGVTSGNFSLHSTCTTGETDQCGIKLEMRKAGKLIWCNLVIQIRCANICKATLVFLICFHRLFLLRVWAILCSLIVLCEAQGVQQCLNDFFPFFFPALRKVALLLLTVSFLRAPFEAKTLRKKYRSTRGYGAYITIPFRYQTFCTIILLNMIFLFNRHTGYNPLAVLPV